MVVWMKKCKQFICDEQNCDQELSLVDTCFQDLVEGVSLCGVVGSCLAVRDGFVWLVVICEE